MTPLSERVLLSVAEAAELTGVSRDTIYDLAAEGRIPARRIGTRLMIPRLRLEQWANEGDMVEVLAPSKRVAS